jgi:hypothetical protein
VPVTVPGTVPAAVPPAADVSAPVVEVAAPTLAPLAAELAPKPSDTDAPVSVLLPELLSLPPHAANIRRVIAAPICFMAMFPVF